MAAAAACRRILSTGPWKYRPSPVTRRRFAALVASPLPTMTTQTASDAASRSARAPKRLNADSRAPGHKRTKRERNMTEGSSDEVLRYDIQALLQSRQASDAAASDAATSDAATSDAAISDAAAADDEPLPEEGSETDVEVLDLSSTGDGLAMRPGSRSSQVYVVPFTVPGDTARVRVFRHLRRENQTVADLVSVTTPSPLRDDSRVRCRYFGACAGCQFQMLDYAEQLRLKKRVLEKAYRNFSNLPAHLVAPIGDTIASPLQYGYRTKLTPHFDGPPGSRALKRSKAKAKGPRASFEACPDIGFMQKGKPRVLDIEDCPIGTEAVRLGMARERLRMRHDFASYTRGATILLRESTRCYPTDADEPPPGDLAPDTARSEGDGFVDVKSCETDSKATTTEYVGSHTFTNPAGSFFQNNNSILAVFTSYIRDRILPPPPPPPPGTDSGPGSGSGAVKYLIDAYSGSGLFTITLASVFQHSTGIDIAADSIASARRNAALNGLGDDRCRFIAADAGQLFKNVTYPPDETIVVLDPPRKGCDADFLAQLSRFGPRRVLYVSCNVHTQARDVGILVRGDGGGAKYVLESLVGFDFFPQTGHVEGVAILNRHDDSEADDVEQQTDS